ncbi:MAG: tetratricopeptide repeat protein [Tepidisphaeraceae bacterium]
MPHASHTSPSRLPLILVIVLPLLALWPVVSAEFIPLDDPANVARNPDFNPPSPGNVAHYWVEPFHNMYAPLTYTAWAGLAHLAWMPSQDAAGLQLNPYVFHAANLLVHVANAVMVFLLLRKLAAPPWAACAGALLFALHPMQVETVAWVTCFRDLLAAGFSLASLLAYVSHATATDRRRATRWYVLACVLLAAALLCKPVAVVVPLVAAAIDWGVLRRPSKSKKVGVSPFRTKKGGVSPFRSAAAVAGLLLVVLPAAYVAKSVQSAELTFTPPLWLKPFIVGDALAFYVRQLLLPLKLGLDYGRSPEWLLAAPGKWWALIVFIALVALIWAFRKRTWVVAGITIFVACLLPVLGLTKFDFQHHSTVADRYAYLAMLGPALILAFAVRNGGRNAAVVVGALLFALAVRSHVQTHAWRDGRSIYQSTLATNPGSLIANRGLGLLAGRSPDAERYFLRALETKPDDPVGNFHIANLYLATNRPAQAIPHYRTAVAARDQPWVATNFATALARTGNLTEAASVLEEALRRSPDSAELHVTLGSVRARQGDRAGAADHYRAALRINPKLSIAAEELAALERATSTSAPAK